MAGNESVGKISLDMEVDGDLSKQISEAANKMAEQIKDSLSNIGNFDFKGMVDTISKSIEKSIDSSMKNIQSTIEKSLNKALSNAMNAIKKFKIPVEFDIPKDFSMPKMNYKVSMAQPRAPPMPKVNASSNTEILKTNIDNLIQRNDIINNQIVNLQNKLSQLKESYNRAFNEERKNKLQDQILSTEMKINKLTSTSDALGFTIANLEDQYNAITAAEKKAAEGMEKFTDEETVMKKGAEATERNTKAVKEKGDSLATAGKKGTVFGGVFKGLANVMNTAKASTNGITKNMDNMNNSMRQSYGGMNMFFDSLFKWGIVFPMIISGLGTMASFLGSALMVNSQFANSLNLIKSNLFTAFMPIYNAVLPALNSLMSALATATAYIASFISQLFGTTYDTSFGAAQAMQSQIGAYTQTQKAAKQAATSLGTVGDSASSSSDKVKKAAKEAKGSVAAFDEVNQLQLTKTPDEDSPKTPKAGKPAGDGVVTPIVPMPNMAPIETATAAWAEKFKNILAGLWAPFKQAWSAEGINTINAAKYALTGIESLIGAIGKSFYTVWTNGTGEKILENLLKILQDILKIIGDISITFADAWNSGNIGTQIVQNLANALNNVLSLIDKMLQSIRFVWAEEGPTFANMFMQSLNAVSGVIENLTQQMGWIWDHGGQHAFEGLMTLGLKIGELALFILTNFVTPFVSWFINLISPAIAVVLNWVGKLFDKMSQAITWLMGSGKPVLEVIVVVLGSFALAWNGVTLAIKGFYGVQALAGNVLTTLRTALNFCTSGIGLWVIGITAAIAIGVLLYKNWDTIKAKAGEVWNSVKQTVEWAMNSIGKKITEIWDGAKDVFNTFDNWLGSVFATDWSTRFGAFGDILNGFLANVKNIWDSVKGIFTGIIDFIAGVFTGNWSRAWKGITEIFGNIFGGIVAIAKVPINGVISLINAAITELDKIKVDIPDWIPDIGGKSFGVSIPKIPYLAQGGIIDKPTTAMIGEAGKEAVVPLENNTGGLKLMAQMLMQEIKSALNNTTNTSLSTAQSSSTVSSSKISANSDESLQYGKDLNTNLGKGITDSAGTVTNSVKTIATNITTNVTNLVKSCISYGQNIDTNLGTGITNNIDSTIKPLKDFISKIVSTIATFVQSCVDYGQKIDLNLGNGITQNSEAAFKPLSNLINSMLSSIKKFIQDCVHYGQDIDNSIAQGITGNSDAVINALNNNVILILNNDLNSFAAGAVKYGQDMDNSISQGISSTIDTILAAVNNLTSKVGSTLQSFAKSCVSYGTAIVDELGSGIKSSEDNLDSIVKDLTDKVITQFRDGFGIHSPSRVMFIIGNYLMQGLINGMTATDVKAFINKWLGDITGSAGGNVAGWLTAALSITGTPMDWLPGLLKLTSYESGDPGTLGSGNATLVNSVPVGNEYATGLLQMLPSTFTENMMPGFDNIFNPIANAIAAIRYIKNRYGSVYNTPLFTSGGAYQGYATGTNSAKKGLAWTGELGPEMIDFSGGEAVLTAMESIKFMERAVNAVGRFKSAISSFKTNVTALRQPELTMMQGREVNNNSFTASNSEFTDGLTTAIVNAILTALKLNSNSQDADHIRDLILQIDGATLARVLKPYLDKENQRVGNKLILKTT